MGLLGKLFGKKDVDESPMPGAEVQETTDSNQFPKGTKPLDPEQATMIAGWLDQAPAFLEEFGDSSLVDEMQNYDVAFGAWLSSGKTQPERDEVISWIGAYLGNRLVTDHSMQWVMVKDQYGEEFGVRHQSLQIVAFPFDTVIKRIESGECGFISVVHKAVGDGIAQGGVAQR